jgi:alanyl-tRNA synthetase
MNSSEIRQQYLDFFASKGHKIVPSAPMVVKNDPTLMFTNAGMNPFKDIFLGNRVAEYKRVADTQKCLRVSGKHNDLEEVGVDTYHHTMFEMLGNWSFGDYFKEDALAWAWELLTDVYKLPKDRLYVTIFEGDAKENLAKDDDAAAIWEKYIDKDRILLGNKKDNFWEMGDVGPCGPCSEIHFDSRSDDERAKIDGKTLVNNDDPNVIEIWNNVFMEFNRKADGSLEPLPAQHVDTGMGFERLVRVIQGKSSNYDTDVFSPLLDKLELLSKKKYNRTDSKEDIAFRVISDHIRAISFSIADGQIPANNGAGYVIRRILRRAIRYGYTYLGFETPFMYQLVQVLGSQLGDVFPEVKAQQGYIENVIREEESSFFKTLSVGVKLFAEKIEKTEGKTISGKDAFDLYDTFGFPIDLTRLMAGEIGYDVDEVEFEKELKIQKDRSRNATKVETEDWIDIHSSATNSEFVGYSEFETEVKILRFRKVNTKNESYYQIVLDKTPFYAESGGQVGDTGYLVNANNDKIEIFNTLKENDTFVHFTKSILDNLTSSFTAKINLDNRKKTAKNHSATHLLQSALRQVLGDHVQQKGSLVNDRLLRFDFAHFAKLTDEEILKVEAIVNQKIVEEIAGNIEADVPLEAAKAKGVTALFGEKYGEKVRVVTFDPSYSMELCGGTHVKNTSEIGFFKILTESSIAAGVRRIEATTSTNVLEYYQKKEITLNEISAILKHPQKLNIAVQNLATENSALKKSMANYESIIANSEAEKIILNNASDSFVFASYVNLSMDILKAMSTKLRAHFTDKLTILATKEDDKLKLVVLAGDAYIQSGKPDAKTIVKEISPIIKGGGGGQPTMANAVGDMAIDLNVVKEKVKELVG